MAKKKQKKNNKKDNKKTNKNDGKISLKFVLWLLVGLCVAIFFFSTTILLFVGMLPTLIAYMVDKLPGKSKTFTIGVMNFSGCFFFLLEAWKHPGDVDFALQLLSNPVTIIVMYGVASIGYFIDYVVTAGVSAVLIQKSKIRVVKIEEEKKVIETRWGAEVTGKLKLDAEGFAFKKNSSGE